MDAPMDAFGPSADVMHLHTKPPPIPARSTLRRTISSPNPREVSDSSTASSGSSDDEPKSPADFDFAPNPIHVSTFEKDTEDAYPVYPTSPSVAPSVIFSADDHSFSSPFHPGGDLEEVHVPNSLLFMKDSPSPVPVAIRAPPSTHQGPPTSIAIPPQKVGNLAPVNTPATPSTWGGGILRRMSSGGGLFGLGSPNEDNDAKEDSTQWNEMCRTGTAPQSSTSPAPSHTTDEDVFSYQAALYPHALSPSSSHPQSPLGIESNEMELLKDEPAPFPLSTSFPQTLEERMGIRAVAAARVHSPVVVEDGVGKDEADGEGRDTLSPLDVQARRISEGSWGGGFMRRMSAAAVYLVAPPDEGDYHFEEVESESDGEGGRVEKRVKVLGEQEELPEEIDIHDDTHLLESHSTLPNHLNQLNGLGYADMSAEEDQPTLTFPTDIDSIIIPSAAAAVDGGSPATLVEDIGQDLISAFPMPPSTAPSHALDDALLLHIGTTYPGADIPAAPNSATAAPPAPAASTTTPGKATSTSVLRRMSTAAVGLMFPTIEVDDEDVRLAMERVNASNAKELERKAEVERAKARKELEAREKREKEEKEAMTQVVKDGDVKIGEDAKAEEPRVGVAPLANLWVRRMSSAMFAPREKSEGTSISREPEGLVMPVSPITPTSPISPISSASPTTPITSTWVRRMSSMLFPIEDADEEEDYPTPAAPLIDVKGKGKAKEIDPTSFDDDPSFPIGSIRVIGDDYSPLPILSPPVDPGPSTWSQASTDFVRRLLVALYAQPEEERDITSIRGVMSPGTPVKHVKRVSFPEDPVGSVKLFHESSPVSPLPQPLGAAPTSAATWTPSFVRRMSTNLTLPFAYNKTSISAANEAEKGTEMDVPTADIGVPEEHGAMELHLPKYPSTGAPRPSWRSGLLRRLSSSTFAAGATAPPPTPAVEQPYPSGRLSPMVVEIDEEHTGELDPVVHKAQAMASLLSALEQDGSIVGDVNVQVNIVPVGSSSEGGSPGSEYSEGTSPPTVTSSFTMDVVPISVAGLSLPTPPPDAETPALGKDFLKRLSSAGFGISMDDENESVEQMDEEEVDHSTSDEA